MSVLRAPFLSVCIRWRSCLFHLDALSACFLCHYKMNNAADDTAHSCYRPFPLSFSFSFFITVDERDDWIAHTIHSQSDYWSLFHCLTKLYKSTIFTDFYHSTTTSNGDHKQQPIGYGKQSYFFLYKLHRTVLCADSNWSFFSEKIFLFIFICFLYECWTTLSVPNVTVVQHPIEKHMNMIGKFFRKKNQFEAAWWVSDLLLHWNRKGKSFITDK